MSGRQAEWTDHALVELELTAPAAVVDDPDVLVLGFGLEERPLDLRRRHGEQRGEDDRHNHPHAAGKQRGAEADRRRRGDERPLRPDPGDRDQRREEGPGQAAGSRERIQAAGHAASLVDMVEREPDEVRSGRTERRDGERKQRQCGEERSDDHAGREGVEPVRRPTQSGRAAKGVTASETAATSRTTASTCGSGRRSASRPPSQ